MTVRSGAIPGAPNFTYEEMIHSNTADARGLDNTPASDAVWSSIEYLATKVLQPLRDHFGKPIIVSSGYRSEAVNKAVGGSGSSFHRFGMAADISSPHVPDRDLFLYICDNLPFSELVAEELPDGWVHVAIARGREDEKKVKYKLVGGGIVHSDRDAVLALYDVSAR